MGSCRYAQEFDQVALARPWCGIGRRMKVEPLMAHHCFVEDDPNLARLVVDCAERRDRAWPDAPHVLEKSGEAAVEGSFRAGDCLRGGRISGDGGIAEAWSSRDGRKLKAHEESARVFLPKGKPPVEGDVFRNPDLARAYRMIAEKGRDAFYKGEIAAAILKTSAKLGGTMTAEDLASFSSEFVTPISRSIGDGEFMNCLRTARGWRRSKC